MKFLQKLFDNPKKAVYFIVAFVLLWMGYAFLSDAEAGEVELGPTYTGEFNKGAAIAVSERLAGHWDVGFGLVSAQTWDEGTDSVGNNGHVWASYVVKRPEKFWKVFPSELGIGPNVWFKDNPPINGCQFGYMLNLKYRFGDRVSVGWRHMSNAGTCRPNRGQDMLMIGWRF